MSPQPLATARNADSPKNDCVPNHYVVLGRSPADSSWRILLQPSEKETGAPRFGSCAVPGRPLPLAHLRNRPEPGCQPPAAAVRVSYLLKSRMRRRRAGVDISRAGSRLGHTPRSRVPTEGKEAEEAGEVEEAGEEAPRGTALALRSRGSVWRRLSTTPE